MRTMLATLSFLLLTTIESAAQPTKYSTANAHSHNDYEQQRPFYSAFENDFGSIEADIFLHDHRLVVAHDSSQLHHQKTLDSLYLVPLNNIVRENSGYVYKRRDRSLQLMIDIKSDAITTLAKLVEILKSFPAITNSPSIKIVVSSNRPAPKHFNEYPSWLLFDGELKKTYTAAALAKIEMLSDNFESYSLWNGNGAVPEIDKQVLKNRVTMAHQSGKKIRFWNAPDNPECWNLLMTLGVDYINTDKIKELALFLQASNTFTAR